MATEVEFTPMSLEKWEKILVSTDASEKTLGMRLLKAAAKHNGKKNVLAYMSKSAEGKAAVIYDFQQAVNPYKANGASDVDHEEDVSEEQDAEEKVEAKPAKKRKTATRKTRKRREDAAAKAKDDSDDEDDEVEETKAEVDKGGAAHIDIDLGPIKASLSTIKESLEAGSSERNALDEKLNAIINRMSGLEKFLIETHAMMRFFVSSQEGMYEMMTDPDLIEEFYGKSAFEDDTEGN